MPTPTIFDLCRPRADILRGSVAEAEFAADLAQVLTGTAPPDYADPARFFANTHPTRGLRDLLANVCRRLSGAGGEAAAIFRLDTSYGGGKTHGLIALTHAARGMEGVADPDEFVDLALLPNGPVRVAAFDGENADPASGRSLEHGLRAHTPWGKLAYALAGRDGYDRIRESDQRHVAPGAGTLRELFGGQPTLILLDELSIYLRKAQGLGVARGQLTSFLSSLFKAVEGTRNACVVYTLAIGKGEEAVDAYSEENRHIAESMAELEKTSARKATLLNPTEEDETVHVLRRRLFESVDEARVPEVVAAYRRRWEGGRDSLSPQATRSETVEAFRAGYPFHPEVLDTLTGKTATLDNFQRVRGMLRLLGKTVAHLWRQRPGDACAVHLHHIDPGHEPIRQEIVTRLGQSPAIGDLAELHGLGLMGTFNGSLPSEIGRLSKLRYLSIGEWGWSDGSKGNLVGRVPDEWEALTSIRSFQVYANPGLTGPLPEGMTGWADTHALVTSGTSLCVPKTEAFREWLSGLSTIFGGGTPDITIGAIDECIRHGADFFVMQAVQSLQRGATLLGGEEAFLRVFFNSIEARPRDIIPSVHTFTTPLQGQWTR